MHLHRIALALELSLAPPLLLRWGLAWGVGRIGGTNEGNSYFAAGPYVSSTK